MSMPRAMAPELLRVRSGPVCEMFTANVEASQSVKGNRIGRGSRRLVRTSSRTRRRRGMGSWSRHSAWLVGRT